MRRLGLTGQKPTSDMFWRYWEKGQNAQEDLKDQVSVIEGIDSTQLRHLLVPIAGGHKIEAILVGQGKPILLIPGLGVTASIWLYQLDWFSSDYQVIVIHPPGHGLSNTTDDLSSRGMCGVLHEVLQQMDIKIPVHVVGACTGANMAVKFTELYPDLTSTLTLVSPIIEWDSEVFDDSPLSRPKIKAIMGFINNFNRDLTRDYNDIVDNVIQNNPVDDIIRFRHLHIASQSIDPMAYVKYVIDMLEDEDIDEQMQNIQRPALLVLGEKDSLIDQNITRKKLSCISEYQEITGAGHFPYVTHSNEFNAGLKRFIQKYE